MFSLITGPVASMKTLASFARPRPISIFVEALVLPTKKI